MQKRKCFPLSTFVCLGAIIGSQAMWGQVCPSSVVGYYSYSALGNGLPGSLLNVSSGSSTSGTGTTGTTGGTGSTGTGSPSAYSNTEVGQLLSGISGNSIFSSSGTLYFDGNGNIWASSTS